MKLNRQQAYEKLMTVNEAYFTQTSLVCWAENVSQITGVDISGTTLKNWVNRDLKNLLDPYKNVEHAKLTREQVAIIMTVIDMRHIIEIAELESFLYELYQNMLPTEFLGLYSGTSVGGMNINEEVECARLGAQVTDMKTKMKSSVKTW